MKYTTLLHTTSPKSAWISIYTFDLPGNGLRRQKQRLRRAHDGPFFIHVPEVVQMIVVNM